MPGPAPAPFSPAGAPAPPRTALLPLSVQSPSVPITYSLTVSTLSSLGPFAPSPGESSSPSVPAPDCSSGPQGPCILPTAVSLQGSCPLPTQPWPSAVRPSPPFPKWGLPMASLFPYTVPGTVRCAWPAASLSAPHLPHGTRCHASWVPAHPHDRGPPQGSLLFRRSWATAGVVSWLLTPLTSPARTSELHARAPTAQSTSPGHLAAP